MAANSPDQALSHQAQPDQGLADSNADGNPLRAKYYADSAGQFDVAIGHRAELAKDTYLVRLKCPQLAAGITPGQFVMVRSKSVSDALLGRAFALYDVIRDADRQPESIDIVFHIVGKMTHLLATAPLGTELVVWGPLGNGFSIEPTEDRTHLVMVAGGIGQTPFLTLAKECLSREQYGNRKVPPMSKVTLCYGARNKHHLAGVPDFESAGVEVRTATDDGSTGHHGLVTDVLANLFESESPEQMRVVCCGPEPMMEAVAQVTKSYEVPCEVSLETPMACGMGICFSCVAKVQQPDGSWDFKRTCVDGPIFDADKIVW